jgi:hypothetical protein
VQAIALSHDGKRLLIGGASATKLFDVETGEGLCTVESFANGEWAVTDPRGFYDASNPDKMSNVYWVVDGRPVDLGQFKRQFHVPGLLAMKMGRKPEK